MRSPRGYLEWYEVLLLGLAAVVVYPDKVLEWIGEWTGWSLGFRHLIYLEMVALGLIVLAMSLLMPAYPQLAWWKPILMIGFLGVVRLIVSWVTSFLGFGN
ncbi:MAG: hypothetical protein J0M24_09540 [Verrucomicrobia bacterium]|nr:hypothetical protein [Verrucomicrobiota bacterium]